MSETVVVAIIGAISLIIGAASGAYVTARRLPSEIKRADIDTNHVAVNAANDALKLLKEAFVEQTRALTTAIEYLRQQVEAGQKQAGADAVTILSLNRILGQRMRDNEAQMHQLESLLAKIDDLTRDGGGESKAKS